MTDQAATLAPARDQGMIARIVSAAIALALCVAMAAYALHQATDPAAWALLG